MAPTFPSQWYDGFCHICGSSGATFHYNAYSCQSCRVFFVRALLRGRPFTCHLGNKCIINPKNRANCAACRFQKCKDSRMTATEVGKFKRQGISAVRYFNRVELQAITRKIGKPVSLGFHYVKELDSKQPALKFSEILIALEKMCFDGPRLEVPDIKVDTSMNLADVLIHSQQCCPRTAITWDKVHQVQDMTDYMVSHYCRATTVLADFMTGAPEFHRMTIVDRLKLGRYNMVDLCLLTVHYRMIEMGIREGILFMNGIHLKPATSEENNPVTFLATEVAQFMQEHVIKVFTELEITENEVMLLKMLVLFQSPPDISDDGREIIRQANSRYSRILHELIAERFPTMTRAENLKRLTRIMRTLAAIKRTSLVINSVMAMMVAKNIGKMQGTLTYDMHFRQF